MYLTSLIIKLNKRLSIALGQQNAELIKYKYLNETAIRQIITARTGYSYLTQISPD